MAAEDSEDEGEGGWSAIQPLDGLLELESWRNLTRVFHDSDTM